MFIPREIILLVGLGMMAGGIGLMLRGALVARARRREAARDRRIALRRLAGFSR